LDAIHRTFRCLVECCFLIPKVSHLDTSINFLLFRKFSVFYNSRVALLAGITIVDT
jgi:hypothetical protein